MNLKNAPEEVRAIKSDKVQDLDVRPILKSGGEPFSQIMETIGRTSPDGAMRLRATFEPKPLFRVLGAKGWSHWVEHGEGDDWIIWFYQKAAPGEPPASVTQELKNVFPELGHRLATDKGVWVLDVRDLAPPEPMELTLAVVEKLPADTRLRQLNRRVPEFLLPILTERGFSYEIERKAESVQLEIFRR